MITKAIIKDYVLRKCPFLAKAEMDDKTYLKIIEDYIESTKESIDSSFGKLSHYDELEEEKLQEEAFGDEDDGDKHEKETLDVIEIMKDHPEWRKLIKAKLKEIEDSNPLNALVAKYENEQLCGELSRRYIELQYGKEVCKRCDINGDGEEIVNQDLIVAITKQFLDDPAVKVIFEGQIEHNDLRARFDVLIKEDDGSYTLLEAKGTNNPYNHSQDKLWDTSIKPVYLYDILFQNYVYTRAGLNISRLGFLYLNKNFKYSSSNPNYPNLSDKDIKELFKVSFELNTKKGVHNLYEYLNSEDYQRKTKEGKARSEAIEDIIDRLREIAKDPSITPKKHYECGKSGKCPLIRQCFNDADDPNSIFNLTKWSQYGGAYTKTIEILDGNTYEISNIPTNILNDKFPSEVEDKETGETKYKNARSQINFQREWKNEPFEYVIRKKKMEEIFKRDYYNNKIDYLVFFDFESIQNPIPLMCDANPWQQIVTQYSMHIVKKGYDLTEHDFENGKGGGCSHYQFIGHPSKDGYHNPEFDLFKTLRDQLINFGVEPMAKNYRVVVFNKSFEKTRMDEFVRKYISHPEVDPDLVNFVQNFNNNVVDLLDFFTSGSMYGRKFNGRGSLKVVQPTLCEDPDVNEYYKNLGLPFDLQYSLNYHKAGALVYNGGICLDLYKTLLIRHFVDPSDNDPDEEEMLDQALAYCKIDSWGTVIIYDVIKHVLDGKIKLKALIL